MSRLCCSRVEKKINVKTKKSPQKIMFQVLFSSNTKPKNTKRAKGDRIIGPGYMNWKSY